MVIVRFGLNLDVFLTPLMVLGTQWYILFNVIAGAAAFPGDLKEVASNFRVGGLLWWRRVIIPGILPYFVTGAITASGGSWNAAIVAEVASWGNTKLAAHGLGAYIAQATDAGDFPHRARRGGDVALCRGVQPAAVAAALCLRQPPRDARLREEMPMDAIAAEALLQVRACRQAYHKDSSADLVVLDDVNLTLQSGEIVGLLGRSGSGKSTLLRIVSGLLAPTAGEVIWRGQAVRGPAPGIAMVFQSFALFPWLTVQENVELGLEAQGVPRAEREQRAEGAIDLIGLGGYESAYPKELSGGMRQRVGLARALVVHPDLLLMDEPFSALDVLTAETLRTDLIDLWMEGRLPVKSILMVTHNIEEAVLMCDRVLVFASNPGRVAQEIRVPFAHPRNRLGARVPATGGRNLCGDDAPGAGARTGTGGARRCAVRRQAAPCFHQPAGRADGGAGRPAL